MYIIKHWYQVILFIAVIGRVLVLHKINIKIYIEVVGWIGDTVLTKKWWWVEDLLMILQARSELIEDHLLVCWMVLQCLKFKIHTQFKYLRVLRNLNNFISCLWILLLIAFKFTLNLSDSSLLSSSSILILLLCFWSWATWSNSCL